MLPAASLQPRRLRHCTCSGRTVRTTLPAPKSPSIGPFGPRCKKQFSNQVRFDSRRLLALVGRYLTQKPASWFPHARVWRVDGRDVAGSGVAMNGRKQVELENGAFRMEFEPRFSADLIVEKTYEKCGDRCGRGDQPGVWHIG